MPSLFPYPDYIDKKKKKGTQKKPGPWKNKNGYLDMSTSQLHHKILSGGNGVAIRTAHSLKTQGHNYKQIINDSRLF